MKKLLLLIFFANTIIAQEKINDSICSEVSFKEDKFNGEKSYNSPDIDNISFVKYVNKGKINQYVSISIYDTYFSGYNNYGLSVLFKSGKKIIPICDVNDILAFSSIKTYLNLDLNYYEKAL